MTHTIRRTAGAFGIAIAAFVTLAAPAGAAGETIGGCAIEAAVYAEEAYGSLHAVEEDEELFKKLEKEMESCLEAPSPIIPEVDEIIWGGAAFAVLFGFMAWKGFPAVKGAMDDRAAKIASDLDAAEQAKVDASQVKADHEAALAGAKAEANQIIEDARQQADQLRTDLQARASEEIAEMRSRASADIESARSQAISDLRSEVASIAVGAAERVIQGNLDAAAQQALVDAYIEEVARG
jgi:F-type H+-transporting ATPase subunit b